MHASAANPISDLIERQGYMVLDGGMATTLEARGFDLDDELWSAKLLLESPEAIRQVHLDFLAAGADCIITASYQASLPGFRKRDLSDAVGSDLLRLSVDLACEARDLFWRKGEGRGKRFKPLVAASIGPYGAYLADGSEYTGDYRISDYQLYDFHLGRWQVLAASEADLLACETIPSGCESAVLLQLLNDTPDCHAWMSFSCKDGLHLCDGTPLQEMVRLCDGEQKVAAIGINCTAPEHISSLVIKAREYTDKMIIVYPNLGESYDAITKTWGSGSSVKDWLDSTHEWFRLGALGIGGCCRIGPETIRDLRRLLLG